MNDHNPSCYRCGCESYPEEIKVKAINGNPLSLCQACHSSSESWKDEKPEGLIPPLIRLGITILVFIVAIYVLFKIPLVINKT